jgi:hypothetical protein
VASRSIVRRSAYSMVALSSAMSSREASASSSRTRATSRLVFSHAALRSVFRQKSAAMRKRFGRGMPSERTNCISGASVPKMWR